MRSRPHRQNATDFHVVRRYNKDRAVSVRPSCFQIEGSILKAQGQGGQGALYVLEAWDVGSPVIAAWRAEAEAEEYTDSTLL